MKLEIHVHIHHECESLAILRDIQTKVSTEGVKVAESPEVTAFREQVSAALENIAADIQRLLSRPNSSLSEEDKATLSAIAQRASDVASVVPEE